MNKLTKGTIPANAPCPFKGKCGLVQYCKRTPSPEPVKCMMAWMFNVYKN